MCRKSLLKNWHCALLWPSSETQGQLVGARKSLNGREKNSCAEKSRATRRAPEDKVLTDQLQTAGVVLTSDWCHKTFVFLCLITTSKTRSRFAYSHTIGCSPYVYSGRKVPITAQNVGEIARHIRKKLVANTLDLLQVSQP